MFIFYQFDMVGPILIELCLGFFLQMQNLFSFDPKLEKGQKQGSL